MIEPETPSTDAALPDEDLMVFPDTWKRLVRPQRGDGKRRHIKLEPEEGRALRAAHLERVHKRLKLDANLEYKAPALAFLDGEADVLGAAVVMALTKPSTDIYTLSFRPMFDFIAAEHGLPFAVAALAEFFTFEASQSDGPSGNGIGLFRMKLDNLRWQRLAGHSQVREIRALIADASDADHAAILAALAERRTSPAHRLAVSVLVPHEEAWMDQVCQEHDGHAPGSEAVALLLDLITTGDQLRALDLSRMTYRWVQAAEIADFLHRLGAEALPLIEWHLGAHCEANEKKTLYRALAAMPSDKALERLLDELDEPVAVGFAMEAATRFPKRTLRLIARLVPGADTDLRKRLSALLYSDPILLDAALPQMDEAVRESIGTLTVENRRLPEAPADALPTLLTEPPWTAGENDSAAVVIKGLKAVPINRMVWAEGEHEEWSQVDYYGLARYRGEGWEERWKTESRDFAGQSGHHQALLLAAAPKEMTAELLPHWKVSTTDYYYVEILKRILANLGADAADQVAAATSGDAALREVLLPVANLAVARIAADAFVRLKTMRPFAIAWLDRHAADGAALLIPDALGKSRKPRAAAEAALRHIASARGADVVREAAARYGDEAAEAIAALVDIDPLTPVGIQVPKPGAWASPAALPQVRLAGRELGVPLTAVRNLATVLALGTLDYDYPGIAVLAEAFDRASLARFSMALFELWNAAGAPADDGWALTQLSHFADDEAVRVLGPLIARWPGENQHQRAVKGLKVLGAIGSETALRAINQIAEKAKFAAIKAEAGDQINTIARTLGLTTEQLADRLVPDFGLREEAALVLDYGPRQFKVGFDEALKPFVSDMDGKPRKSLPKPGAKDDDLLADAAYKRFAALRKDLRTVSADQVKRLERAMVQGRTWTLAEFDEFFVQHPLVWHLARRLVWMALDGDDLTAFRLAEDKGYTDVEEEELQFPADALIRLAHPALMGGDEISAWAEIFADYEILQPFDQLGRPVLAFTEEELRTGHLTRFEGVTVPVGKLLGLTGKGWDRAAPQDAGIEPGMTGWLHGIGYIVIDLEPGIWVGAVEQYPEQTLRTVVVADQNLNGWRIPEPMTDFGPVDPVVASEALAALAKATGVS
jgi:hypothetical protein